MDIHEKNVLISLAENIISYSNEQPGLQDLARISLAALTAEPVKVPDELTMREAIRLKLSVDWAAGYNTAIAHCKELSEPIDNTAQQYEALAKEEDNG